MAPDAAAASSQVPPARNSSDGASAGAQQQQLLPSKQLLWEYFVVLGLPSSGLQTVHGEGGFLGTNDQTRYKPALVDSLAASSTAQPDERCQLPPQLPTVSSRLLVVVVVAVRQGGRSAMTCGACSCCTVCHSAACRRASTSSCTRTWTGPTSRRIPLPAC
jgi:hypothetical protein